MKKSKIKNIGIVIIILVVGFLGMTLLSNSENETQKRDVKPEVRTVKTELLTFGDINLNISGNGIVESKSVLDVTSEVSGKVDFAKNNLKNGTFAKKGEVVVKVDSREVENNLFSTRSDFVNAVATLLPELKVEGSELYKKWFDYFSDLDIHKILPELPAVSNLQEKIKLSSRQIFTKYYAVKNQEILLSKHIISAPFTGYIKSKGIIENSFISRGQNLFTIEDVYNLEIAVPLLVDEFNQIEFDNNTNVKISSDNTTKIIEGKLIRKDPVLDRNSQSLKVYIAFSNFEMVPDFLAGNYVNVNIEGKKLNNVTVIARHLVDGDNNIYIMKDGKLATQKLDIVEIQKDKIIAANNFDDEIEIVTTILQKPLVGMNLQSFSDVIEADSILVKNDSVVSK